MRIVVQRVSKASVSVDDNIVGKVGQGFLVLLGIKITDTYKDADTCRPENLPTWFKQYPVVLVDRDDIYRLENTHPKHRHRNGY